MRKLLFAFSLLTGVVLVVSVHSILGAQQEPLPLTDSRPLRARVEGLGGPRRVMLGAASVPSRASFWSYDFYTGLDFTVTATLRYTGTYAYIYTDDAETIEITTVISIASTFDSIYPVDVANFGAPPDVDGEDRITILVLDIRDAYYHDPFNATYVPAYFDPIHEYPGIPYSNGREMLFLDCDPLVLPDGAGRPLAHELEHLIHWGHDNQEEIWLDEGLAELAAWLCGYGHSPGVPEYLADPSRGLTSWTGSFGDHAAAYLWALYLYEQYGRPAIRDLVASAEHGMNSVTTVMGEDAADVFRRWALANWLDDDGTVYGYDALEIGPGGYTRPPVSTHVTPDLPGERLIFSGTIDYWGVSYHLIGQGGSPRLHLWEKNGGQFRQDVAFSDTFEDGDNIVVVTSWLSGLISCDLVSPDRALIAVSLPRSTGSRDYVYDSGFFDFIPLILKEYQ